MTSFTIMASFCASCGKEISGGTRYCPVCGHDSMGSGNKSNNSGNRNQNTSQGLGGTLTLILVLGVIWALFCILGGILTMVSGGFYEMLIEDYFSITISGLAELMFIIGLITLIGGICCLVSCVRIFQLEKHDQATALCAVSSVIALFTGGLIVGIIGLIFWYLLKKEKHRFSS
jgi:predicted RNA-binding Zn-ribbon protein involved in translation (DUF1610 family)